MTDRELLDEYARSGSEQAFGRLVERHAAKVYSVCLHALGEAGAAEDAAQAAFMVLARKAKGLARGTVLSGWLFLTARTCAQQLRRAEARRARREKEAAAMRASEEASSSWEDVRPHLGAAMAALPRVQRDALTLCYLDGRTRVDAAAEMGCSMKTLDTRVTRGLARLRKRLAGRGAPLAGAALTVILSEKAVAAVPAGFAVSCKAAAFGKAAASPLVQSTVEGTMKAMFWMKAKFCAAALAGLAVAGIGAGVALSGAVAGERSKASGVTIDGQKRICIDGKPFFPIGIYSVLPDKLAHARELGFNTVHTYGGEGNKKRDNAKSPEQMRAYLDAADKLGLKVFMGLPRFQVIKGEAKRLEERIKLLRGHRALLTWYLFDEPFHQKVPAAPVQASADLIRKLDPNHPTVMVLCLLHKRRGVHEKNPVFVSMPDILMADRYPLTPRNANLSPVAQDIAVARRLVKDAKPVWNVVQLHGKGPGGAGYGLKEPDWAELRNMTYQSLAAGARGITFFAHCGGQFNLCKSPQGLKNARRIATELGTLSPILLSDRPARPAFAVEKNKAILHRSFVHGGKAYLIVVNLTRQNTTLSFSRVSGRMPAAIKVLFEGRTVKTAGGKLVEELEPVGTRVYEVEMGA